MVTATVSVSDPAPAATALGVTTPAPEREPTPTRDPRLDLVASLDATEIERAIVLSLLDRADAATPDDLLEAVRSECAAIAEDRRPVDATVRRLVDAEPGACPEPVPTPTSPRATATVAPAPTALPPTAVPPTPVPPTPVPAASLTPIPPAPIAAPPTPTAIPAPAPPPVTSTPLPPPPTFYANCDAARDAGVAPIPIGQPGYRPGLDRDNDGLACDEDGSTPSSSAQERQCQGAELKIDGSCYLLAGAPQFNLDTERAECENGARQIDENCYLYVGPAR